MLRWWLAIEFVLLFVVPPTAFVVLRPKLSIIPALLMLTVVCAAILLSDRRFDRRKLWNAPAIGRSWKRILIVFIPAAIGLAIGTMLFEPQRLLALPRERPELWALIMVLYPLFSVYPQELVYRAFLFHRYRPLFGDVRMLIGASAVAFGYVHIVFENVLAVALTLLGGVLFAWTYARSRSTLAASVEHALYGCFIFTIGLGWYFYGGAVR